MAGRLLVLLALVLFASGARAAELYLTTFLQASPLKGLDVELDGRPVGVTGERGDVTAELDAGSHVVRLLKNAVPLTQYRFSVGEDESAELSITFSDFETEPEISIAKYGPGAQDGAPGVLSGVVRDAAGNPVAGARVSIPQTGAEVLTDAGGAYSIELPRGTYTVSVTQPGYRTATSENVRVVANIGVVADVTLRRSDEIPAGPAAPTALEEVVVVGVYKPTERAADKERFAVTITDAIDIDELLRFGDSDVAAGLKRIVGVAVTGGRYANVRGLAGRYISSTLNGSLMPSTDPFRRDVELDLFPAEILGTIEVQKGFSPNLPGDTTGGAIRMTTRGLPDEDEAGISLSVGYVGGTTGEDLLTYEGGDRDWTGFDDGTRDLPGAVRGILEPGGFGLSVSGAEAGDEAATLPVIYNTERDSAEPDFELGAKFGRRHEWTGGDFGYYAALTYGQKHKSRQEAEWDNVQGNAEGEIIWDNFEVGLDGYLVAGWEAASGWSLTSKTILLRETEDRASIESGYDRINTEVFQVDTTLEWIERQFVGEQIESVIPLFGEHELSLRGSLARTSRESPDRRFYQYRNGEFNSGPFERSYADLTEDAWELGADYEWPIRITDSVLTNLRFGLLANRADRDNELIRLSVDLDDADPTADPETLLSAEAFESGRVTLRSSTAATDSYDAVRETQAAYVNTETDFGASWSLAVGARFEDYSLDLNYPYAAPAVGSIDPDRDESDLLPAVNLTYRIGEDIQLRGGYSQTVSRPDITELAASRFYDAEGRPFEGNPSLVDSTIDNFDLRAEYYFNDTDSVTLALFYKEIDAPIEVTLAPGLGFEGLRGFANGESAEVSGVELDASYRLLDGANHGLLLGGNLAWIDSEIKLEQEQAINEGREKRELQGQSPFLANLQLAYDYYPFDAKATLAVNYFDDRIYAASQGSNLDPTYEEGRADVNLTAEKGFRDGSKVSLKVRNLLDAPIERTQNGRVRETYKLGTSLSLGYSLSF